MILSVLLLQCSPSTNTNGDCGFLLNLGVNTSLNLNLPQYNPLNFPSNPVYVPNAGNGGIIVTNTGAGFVAFDAADPNHYAGDCSILSINGIEGVCNCDDANTYNLFTGLPVQNNNLRCSLKAYPVEVSGNTVFINY